MQQMDWAGTTNGELLHRAAIGGFDALVTVDRGFEYQHNVSELPIPVVILVALRNRVQGLQPLVPGVIAVLSENLQRRIYRVSSQVGGGCRSAGTVHLWVHSRCCRTDRYTLPTGNRRPAG